MAVAVAPRSVAAPTGHGRAGLRPVDRLVLGYSGVVILVALLRAAEYPGCWWIAAAHALVAALVLLVTRPGLGVLGRTIRELYPLLLLVAFYSALDVLNGGGARPVHDALVQRWELALFGEQVSREWWRRAPSAFWSTVLHASYFSYYVILVIPAAWFGWQRHFTALRRYVFTVAATFFVCYLVFMFFPVAGPYYAFPRPTGAFVDNAAARLVYDTLASGSSYGAAFPSSHVAATLAATLAAWTGSRRLGLGLAVPTILLTVSVVYCQMHYAVDALAGLAVGGVMVVLGRAANG